MAERDVIVIGGSAGAIEALLALVRGLPANLQAAVFVVVHVPAGAVSYLPDILSRAGPLTARHPHHNERIEPGRIYVAPPDRHMQIRCGSIELSRGPRENHSRPAIDPLFRSAARSYGSGTIGVILSGALYDGSNGLLAVKARGGIAIVQDPEEAITASMPRSALALVRADFILSAEEIGPRLGQLVREPAIIKRESTVDEFERITQVIDGDFAEQVLNQRAGDTTMYTCPDCGGVLWQTDTSGGFRCHVGHAYSAESLLVQKSEQLETALWASVRLFREKSALTRQTAVKMMSLGNPEMAERFEEQSQLEAGYAAEIRQLLETGLNPNDQLAGTFFSPGHVSEGGPEIQ